MLLVMTLMFLLYFQLGILYRNISWLSMISAFVLGFNFYLCDPDDEKLYSYRVWAIAFLIACVGCAVLLLFLGTNPPLIAI